MHIFPALIGKLRRDVTDDTEVLQDCDFPYVHRGERYVVGLSYLRNQLYNSKRQVDEAQLGLLAFTAIRTRDGGNSGLSGC